ncbi:MAG: hypothetical protein V1663_05010, partial [archaeon]
NEVINIIATIVFTFASLLAPLTIVAAVSGFQPLFVFLIGIGFSIFLPKLIKEDLDKGVLIQKIFFIILMFIGAYILNLGL